jgi:hypothetical protein
MPKGEAQSFSLEAVSAEPDWDCWSGPPASLFAGAFLVAPAAIALAISAAGFAASQLGVAVVAQARAGQAYPAARQNLPALPELLRLRPGSPLEVAAVPVLPLPLRACSSP